jgi:protein-S-isoprenylcysteine O-methyltransferase Ste14
MFVKLLFCILGGTGLLILELKMDRKKPLPPTYFNVSIVLIILLHFFWPVEKIISFPWNLFGIIPLISGIVFNLLADRAFKIKKTTVKPFEESSVLITTGVFRISRNPMYLGMVMILVGAAILLGSLSPYLVIIIFITLMQIKFIHTEEKMLNTKFTEAWQNYKNRTRPWL